MEVVILRELFKFYVYLAPIEMLDREFKEVCREKDLEKINRSKKKSIKLETEELEGALTSDRN